MSNPVGTTNAVPVTFNNQQMTGEGVISYEHISWL